MESREKAFSDGISSIEVGDLLIYAEAQRTEPQSTSSIRLIQSDHQKKNPELDVLTLTSLGLGMNLTTPC